MMTIKEAIDDGQFMLEHTNNHHRVPLRNRGWAIVTTTMAPGTYPLRGWLEDGDGSPYSWTAEGWRQSDRTGDLDLVMQQPPRKLAIEMVVDVDVETGRVTFAMQHFPQGLAEVPVLVQLNAVPRRGSVRANIKGEVELP